jgi:ABC-type cobalamin/Fe3+-siderophores transport system ATPase subunit
VNNSLSRVKLRFAGLEIEFTDRDRGIQQVLEFAEKSTWYPIVVFGPEGCGKTSWLKQSVEVLRKLGFDTIYIDPMHRDFITYTDVWECCEKIC